MKLVDLFISSILLFTSMSLLAAGGGFSPSFGTAEFDGTITMAAQGAWCGAVTFVPKTGNKDIKASGIKLVAYRVTKGPLSATDWGQPIGETVVKAPLRQRYDWAGINAYDRYAVKCYVMATEFQGGEYAANCNEVIEIPDDGIRHNVGCVIGPAGPDANYSPLNMNKG
jgi:hypothetical protein